MTLVDMCAVGDMFINLSENTPGSFVEVIMLPGIMTGRQYDRKVLCLSMPSMPQWDGKEEWVAFLQRAVDHVDFKEVVCS